jgi:hypothetical protein
LSPINPAAACARPLRRALEDGMLEIFIGLGWLLVGAGSLVAIAHLASPISRLITPCVSFFAVFMTLGAKKVKTAYIFPRTGYVVLRRTPRIGWREALIVAVVLSAFTALLLAANGRVPNLWDVSGPLAALVMAAGFVCGGIFFRFPHLHPLAGFSLVAGAATYLAAANASGVLWVMLSVGAALALSGVLRFRSFLRTHPVIQEEEQ